MLHVRQKSNYKDFFSTSLLSMDYLANTAGWLDEFIDDRLHPSATVLLRVIFLGGVWITISHKVFMCLLFCFNLLILILYNIHMFLKLVNIFISMSFHWISFFHNDMPQYAFFFFLFFPTGYGLLLLFANSEAVMCWQNRAYQLGLIIIFVLEWFIGQLLKKH